MLYHFANATRHEKQKNTNTNNEVDALEVFAGTTTFTHRFYGSLHRSCLPTRVWLRTLSVKEPL